MAQHGDLQVPIIDTRSDEQAEQAAQDAIQEGIRARGQSDGLPGVTATHVNGPIEFVYPTGPL
jgi:hypothetical protein